MNKNLSDLKTLMDTRELTPQTKTTGLRVAIANLDARLLELRAHLFDLYVGLHEGFTDHDEAGFEFCPLCDQSRTKGHAETCLWVKLEEMLGAQDV